MLLDSKLGPLWATEEEERTKGLDRSAALSNTFTNIYKQAQTLNIVEVEMQEGQDNVAQAVLKDVGAARFLNMQVKTLRNWRSKKIGPDYIRYGRAIRYRIGDLERFLEERVVRNKS